jgi:large subunit ribosomal protein L9
MEVILRQDIPQLGKIGEVVQVRNGFARNYLLPRGLVLVANKKNLRGFEHQKKVVGAQKEKAEKAARSLADKLAAVSLRIPVKTGEGGRLFGSVTNMDIEKALRQEGLEIDRRRIHLEEPLKVLGDYEVPVRLTADLAVNIRVSVVPEE